MFIAHKLCYTLLQIPNASLTGPPSHLLLHSLFSHAPEPVWPSGQLGARLVSTADEHRFESARDLLSIHNLRLVMMMMMTMMMSTFIAHGTINLNAQYNNGGGVGGGGGGQKMTQKWVVTFEGAPPPPPPHPPISPPPNPQLPPLTRFFSVSSVASVGHEWPWICALKGLSRAQARAIVI